MENLKGSEVILSIETTTLGGSLSILSNSFEIDGWSGRREVSKADDILEQISKILTVNKIEKKNVKLICVSGGTLSSTGEKIGLAIGKGLAKAFGCSLQGVSLLESLLLEVEDEPDGEYCTAVPGGKKVMSRQRFTKKGKSFFPVAAVEVCEADRFFELAESFGCKKIVVATTLAADLGYLDKKPDKNLFIKNKFTLANLNARAALKKMRPIIN